MLAESGDRAVSDSRCQILLVMPVGGTVTDIVSGQSGEALGVNILATALKSAGFHVKVLSYCTEYEVLRDVQEHRPLMLGLSATWANLDRCAAIAKASKRLIPNLRVLVGGPGVSFNPDEVMDQFPQFDVVAFGEGQQTIVELAAVQQWPDNLHQIAGIVYRYQGSHKKTENRKGISDLSLLPSPDRDELKLLLSSGTRVARILTSWGCPEDCSFCVNGRWITNNRPAESPRRLMRSPDEVVNEIDHLYNMGARLIIFADEDVIGNSASEVDRLARLIDGIRQLGKQDLHFSIMTTVRSALTHKSLLEAFAKNGLRRVFLGVENTSRGDLRRLRSCGKTPLRGLSQVAEILNDLGIFCMAGFIMFNPFTTTQDILENSIFFDTYPHSLPAFASAVFRKAELYPGTRLYDWHRENGSLWYVDPVTYQFVDETIQQAADFLDELWRRVYPMEVELWRLEEQVNNALIHEAIKSEYYLLRSHLATLNIQTLREAVTQSLGSRRHKAQLAEKYLRQHTLHWDEYRRACNCCVREVES